MAEQQLRHAGRRHGWRGWVAKAWRSTLTTALTGSMPATGHNADQLPEAWRVMAPPRAVTNREKRRSAGRAVTGRGFVQVAGDRSTGPGWPSGFQAFPCRLPGGAQHAVGRAALHAASRLTSSRYAQAGGRTDVARHGAVAQRGGVSGVQGRPSGVSTCFPASQRPGATARLGLASFSVGFADQYGRGKPASDIEAARRWTGSGPAEPGGFVQSMGGEAVGVVSRTGEPGAS